MTTSILQVSDIKINSNIITATRISNTSETEALGLDYCITTHEVQLIQSQPVHSEHVT